MPVAMTIEAQARAICAAIETRKVHHTYWLRKRSSLGANDVRLLDAVMFTLRLKRLKSEGAE